MHGPPDKRTLAGVKCNNSKEQQWPRTRVNRLYAQKSELGARKGESQIIKEVGSIDGRRALIEQDGVCRSINRLESIGREKAKLGSRIEGTAVGLLRSRRRKMGRVITSRGIWGRSFYRSIDGWYQLKVCREELWYFLRGIVA